MDIHLKLFFTLGIIGLAICVAGISTVGMRRINGALAAAGIADGVALMVVILHGILAL